MARTPLRETRQDLTRMLMWLDAWGQDLRYAGRMLRRSPAFTLAAVLSLALGIGATTMVFSAIHGIVIEPFPYRDPDTLMAVNIRDARSVGVFGSLYSIDDYLDLEAQARVFDAVIVSTITDVVMIGSGEPERLRGNYVSMNTFEVMGVQPLLGRGTLGDDAKPEAAPIAVLSYTFWQRRFGGDPHVLGQQLRLNGTSRTVVGVMPPRFLWRGADVYLPVVFHRGQTIDDVRIVHLMGRLKPAVTRAQAETDLRPIIQAMRDRQPQTGQGDFRIQLLSFKETFRSPLRSALWLLLGAVALLLLIACGNVSNLLLARTSTRAREIAVRTSLGASRGRVIRQLLTESLVLAASGGLLGILIAYGGLGMLRLIVPPDMIPAESSIALNRPVLIFTLAVSMLSAIVFGLAPAMQTAKTGISSVLRESGRGLTGGARQARLRSALIVLEIALSVVLLVAAGLMIRTVMRMQQVALGFAPDRILSLRIPLAPQRYPRPEDRARFFSTLIERTRALPGVADVSATGTQPFQPFPSRSLLDVPGRPLDATRVVAVTETDDRFVPITGIQLLRGRAIAASDVTAARRVGVINETLARTWFGTDDPIGLTVHLKYLQRAPIGLIDDGIEIVGVMKDAPNLNLDQPLLPQILVPYTLNGNNLFLFVRTSLPPRQLDRTVRAQVYAIDKDQPVTEVQTLDTLIDQWSFSAPRFNVVLFAMFAMLGLLLASIGVYGVISYTVARQRQEIGVRMALGAQKSDILRMVMTMGLKLVIAGIAIGCIAAYAASTLLASQLRGVSPHDPVAFVGVIAVLLIVGLQACLWPARRAARIDPLVALRDE